jgi:hypothetical protein
LARSSAREDGTLENKNSPNVPSRNSRGRYRENPRNPEENLEENLRANPEANTGTTRLAAVSNNRVNEV